MYEAAQDSERISPDTGDAANRLRTDGKLFATRSSLNPSNGSRPLRRVAPISYKTCAAITGGAQPETRAILPKCPGNTGKRTGAIERWVPTREAIGDELI